MTKEEQIVNTHVTIVACRNSSSKKAKLEFLSTQRDNPFMREYLRLCYEPKINFYMKKVDPSLGCPPEHKNASIEDALVYVRDFIATRAVSGMAAKESVAYAYNSLGMDYERELLTLLIGRDVKAGFSVNTINSVWPGLITDVPYMRCSLPTESDPLKFDWKQGVFSQLKANGAFANVTHHEDGTVTIESRNGSPFPADMFPEVVAYVKQTIPMGFQLHGELLIEDENGNVLPRKVSNGKLNSVLQGGEFESWQTPTYSAWDIIPVTEAKAKNKYRVPYSERFATLTKLIGDGTRCVSIIETEICHSYAEAVMHYRRKLADGLEGTVIKNPTMIWEDTTSKGQVKMKLVVECELRVIGFNAGNGKNESTFGSLLCESQCGKLQVSVSGFSDDLRAQIAAEKDDWLNSIITVKSNELQEDNQSSSLASLFLPVFVERRFDKTEADSLDRIRALFESAIKGEQ